MTHRDAIVHGDGVEFLGDTTCGFNLTAHQLTQIFQVNVTGYELGKGVGNCNDRLLKILGVHSGGTPERTGTSHIAPLRGGFGSVGRHGHPIRLRGVNSLDFIGNQQSIFFTIHRIRLLTCLAPPANFIVNKLSIWLKRWERTLGTMPNAVLTSSVFSPISARFLPDFSTYER